MGLFWSGRSQKRNQVGSAKNPKLAIDPPKLISRAKDGPKTYRCPLCFNMQDTKTYWMGSHHGITSCMKRRIIVTYSFWSRRGSASRCSGPLCANVFRDNAPRLVRSQCLQGWQFKKWRLLDPPRTLQSWCVFLAMRNHLETWLMRGVCAFFPQPLAIRSSPFPSWMGNSNPLQISRASASCAGRLASCLQPQGHSQRKT